MEDKLYCVNLNEHVPHLQCFHRRHTSFIKESMSCSTPKHYKAKLFPLTIPLPEKKDCTRGTHCLEQAQQQPLWATRDDIPVIIFWGNVLAGWSSKEMMPHCCILLPHGYLTFERRFMFCAHTHLSMKVIFTQGFLRVKDDCCTSMLI